MYDDKSVWCSTSSIRSRDTLKKDIECDVLVVGGGIAGVLTAYYLTMNNVDTVLVEASSVLSGQTKNTTAKITSQHGVCYSEIAKMYSADTAVAYANANELAISYFEELIRNQRINCDFTLLPSYVYTLKNTEKLEREFELLRDSSVQSKLTTHTELPFCVKLALRYDNQAQFNPYPFISKLSDYISIFENTKLLRVEGNIAYCENARIKAKKIVFATHYPVINFPGFYFTRMHQSRSYVVVLKNVPVVNSMYYCADKGGLSIRSYKDMLLLSGGSHRTGEAEKVKDPYDSLLSQAKRYYKNARLCYKFSAQDTMTPDYMPYAGYYSKSKPDWYVLTGFSKWGMTNSMISARLVSDMILGVKNPLESVLSPSRFSASLIKPLLSEAGHAVKGISKSIFNIPLDSVSDIKQGDAKIVMYKGRRCGVYRSEEGELYAVTAHCPHLGCALSFNKAEKTWECPCHGSRFTYKGELLDSPSQTSLKRYSK